MISVILLVWLVGTLVLLVGLQSRFTLKLRNWAISHPRRSRRWVIFLMVLNGFLGWELGKRVLDPALFGKWALTLSLIAVGVIAALYVVGKGRIPLLRNIAVHNRMTRGWMAMAAFFLFVQVGNYDQTYGNPFFQADQVLQAALAPGGDKDREAGPRHFEDGVAEGIPDDIGTLEAEPTEATPGTSESDEIRESDRESEARPLSRRKQVRELRKELRSLRPQDDGTQAGKVILSVLIIALAGAVWLAVAFLSCAIACSGQGVIGALVLIVGTALIIVGVVLLMMKIWQNQPADSGASDNTPGEGDEPWEEGGEEPEDED